MARKRDYEPWDTTRYRAGTRKCKFGHEGRVAKVTGLCAGCLQDTLEKAGFHYGDERTALTPSARAQEPFSREDTGRARGKVILVCGSRKWADRLPIWDALFRLRHETELVIHGAARGADTLAGDVCRDLGIPVHEYPADWDRYGKGAGFIRNSRMLKEGQPDLVLAFTEEPEGGTAQMVKLARKADVEVRVHGPRTTEGPTEAGPPLVASEGAR